jgi:Ca2+-transporting ATPase
MGTSVMTGTALAQVVATGMATELGKIAHLITTAESPKTPLQTQLEKLGTTLLAFCLLVVGLVFGLGIAQGRPWVELLVFSISLAVAAVPEGMPAIVTVALALGVQRLARQKALVRKLPSVETLGSVSVICTDKTGTLTTGNMRVRETHGADPFELLRAAASCCDAELPDGEAGSASGDPTEVAILLAARKKGILKSTLEKNNPRVSLEPFDPARKRMSILRADGKIYVKGALESVLPLCALPDRERAEAEKANATMAGRGLRVLAVAIGQGARETNLGFLGLLGIADPPRPEAMRALADARRAGITPVMITGDHPTTAAAIARELGLLLEQEVATERVFARATPEDKLRLVRAWKKKGAVVAMTGDGVNDAPALREAHIGIAMGKTGTEVTRQAADLVLADDNFATIVTAVKEGRGIYQNIRKAVVYLLTGNFAELVVVLGASAAGLPLPFLASHLLWINLVTDSLPALALIADPVPHRVMTRPPRLATEALIGGKEWLTIAWVGTLEGILLLGLFASALPSEGLSGARSLAFTTLVLSQLWRAFGARSRSRVFLGRGMLQNPWLLAVALSTGVLQLCLHYFPPARALFGITLLGPRELLLVMPLSLLPLTAIEVRKLLLRVWRKKRWFAAKNAKRQTQ